MDFLCERGKVSHAVELAEMRAQSWRGLKRNLIENGICLKKHSYEPYKIHAKALPLLSLLLAKPPAEPNTVIPRWRIQLPRRAAIGSSVIALLSAENTIIEYVLTRTLTKRRVRTFELSLPGLAALSVARFKRPDEFVATLHSVGYL